MPWIGKKYARLCEFFGSENLAYLLSKCFQKNKVILTNLLRFLMGFKQAFVFYFHTDMIHVLVFPALI